MEARLRAHMDELFKDVPKTKQSIEIKEEILQNITDKYRDLLAEGKSEEAAYNIAIAGIGNLDDLLESLKRTRNPLDSALFTEYNAWKKKSALRVSTAVMLYILCVVPPILMTLCETEIADALGAVLMFVLAAIATGILVYNSVSKPMMPPSDGSIAEDFQQWQKHEENSQTDKQLRRAISSALWCIILVLYFVISFMTGAWHISWVIFLIGAACTSIIEAIFNLKK